jgi:ectoine hydroxylase-related dioxygenase (phytanoyl-CoA dioxygenase family)
MNDIATTHELGSMGVAQLKRYWSVRTCRAPVPGRSIALDWARDTVLLHGLGVGVEQASRYLAQERSFAEFEAWVLALNGGFIARQKIARLNAALTDAAYDGDTQQWLAGIEAMPPVLDEADLLMWAEQGYTVLHDAITPAECAAVTRLIYESAGVEAGQPDTWYSRANSQGIMLQVFQHPALEAARNSPRVHKAYSQLWGTPDLLPTTDRCSFNPPEREGNPFPGPHLHWDIELTLPVPFAMQGVLYLTDTAANQGAFSCVPGFHKTIDAWLRALPTGANPYDFIPTGAAYPIAGKAGDLVIWNDALPHGSSPNRAAVPRLVQYVKMFPARVRAEDY